MNILEIVLKSLTPEEIDIGDLRILKAALNIKNERPLNDSKLTAKQLEKALMVKILLDLKFQGKEQQINILNLKGCRSLRELPPQIGELKALKILNLEGCTSLPDAFQQKDLSLSEVIGILKAALNIKNERPLNDRKLTTKQLEIALTLLTEEEKKKINTLNLKACISLEALPESIGRLTALTSLNLAWCSALTSLPETIGDLSRLKELDFQACPIRTLPKTIKNLSDLNYLNFSECESLRSLPDEVGDLGALEILDLSYCIALESVPGTIANLSLLKELNLTGCPITALPDGIGELKALKTLYLQGCTFLRSLPKSIGNLVALETLDLDECEKLSQVEPKLFEGAKQIKKILQSLHPDE